MTNNFFPMLSRIKLIRRWGLMYNTRSENLSEHTLETAYLTHALIALHNAAVLREHGGAQPSDELLEPQHGVMLALYHDCPEILTGDMPTPVKYFSPEISSAYRSVEQAAAESLIGMLPPELRQEYAPYLSPNPEGEREMRYRRFVKAADKLSALIKCIEEQRAGNNEFASAKAQILAELKGMGMASVDIFIEQCLPSYGLTLDELSGGIL